MYINIMLELYTHTEKVGKSMCVYFSRQMVSRHALLNIRKSNVFPHINKGQKPHKPFSR